MGADRRTAVWVGILFLLGYVGVFVGEAFSGPVLDAPDYLAGVYPNQGQLLIGMLIELVNDVAVVGIGVLLFPILRRQSETLAIGYVGLRVIEAVMSVIGKISVLSLIPLSQAYLEAGTPAATYFESLGAMALAQRYWAGQMLTVFFILGAVVLYVALYRSRLVPRLLSVWGLFAAAALAAGNLLGVPAPTEGFEPAMLLFLPIFLSEFLLAGWLIARGFSPAAAQPEPVPAAQL